MADDEIHGDDQPRGIAFEVSDAGIRAAVDAAGEKGTRVLLGVTMVLVHDPENDTPDDEAAADIKVLAGLSLYATEEEGEEVDPTMMLDFILAGAERFATTHGIPLARFEMPPTPGQG